MKHVELNNELMIKKDGFYNLEKDKEAIKALSEEIDRRLITFPNFSEKIHYLIDNDYYYNILDQYSMNQIEEIFSIAHKANFEFQSYMAISKFYNDYAMKTNDKKNFLETYPDRVAIVSLYLAQGNFIQALRNVNAMLGYDQLLQPATPTFLNAGKSRRGEMVSCFLLEMDDSLNSINFILGTCMQLSKIGGGVAVNLSKLRGRGEPIKDVDGAAKGIAPVLKLLEDAFSYADQMGQRKGSGAAYYNIFGWDINEFLDCKKINADEKARIKTLSIGLIVPSIFYRLAEKDEDFYCFAPYSVRKEYGVHLDDMDLDDKYYDLLENPNVKKRKVGKARDFLNKIAQIQMESGYPYQMFKTNANKFHALREIGDVKMSNLCTEIFQLQEASVINNYDEIDEINRDISCNLASINITNVMETKQLPFAVHVGVEMLTSVSDLTGIPNAPSVKKANEDLHSIGLGAMNLHGYLAKNHIQYESKEARDFVRTFFMAMNYYSIEKSMQIARERNVTFKGFELSNYASGEYFEMYLNEDFSPRTEKVKLLFDGIHVPTIADWQTLKENVQKYGLYHAYRLAIAPTQSISYLQNATPSVMPIVDIIETRTYGDSKTFYPMPYLSKETMFYYRSAYDIDQYKIIALVGEIQRHVDQGVSCILYVNSNVATNELARYYVYAERKNLKSLYYTRTKKLSIEECTSCAV
ncbi:class 1b ribonucleoside-diphosphate reductase subunit alpha [Brevibacillus brevis X23]|nr:class 1b ribonucleoside-diphosphate reductase subunit alpha [Brevibacillus brevis X23]